MPVPKSSRRLPTIALAAVLAGLLFYAAWPDRRRPAEPARPGPLAGVPPAIGASFTPPDRRAASPVPWAGTVLGGAAEPRAAGAGPAAPPGPAAVGLRPTPDPAFAPGGLGPAEGGQVERFLRSLPGLASGDTAAVRGMARRLTENGTLDDPAAIRSAARAALPRLKDPALRRKFLLSIADVTAALGDGDAVAAYREARAVVPAGPFTATAGLKEYDALRAAGRDAEAAAVLAELALEVEKMPEWEKYRLVQKQATQAVLDGKPELAVDQVMGLRPRTPEERQHKFFLGSSLLGPLLVTENDALALKLHTHLGEENPETVTPQALSNAWVMAGRTGDADAADAIRSRLVLDSPDSQEARDVQLSFALEFSQMTEDRLPAVLDALDFVEESPAATPADLARAASTRGTIEKLRRRGLLSMAMRGDGRGDLRPVPDPAFGGVTIERVGDSGGDGGE